MLETISKEQATLHIHTDQLPPKRLPVHLILAIPRPIMLKRVLAQAASLGVETISLVRSKRVEKSFLDSSIVKGENFTPYLIKGLEQAVDTIPPEVNIYRCFKPFIELSKCNEPDRFKIIAHPLGGTTLKQAVTTAARKQVTIAIGPEGGWIDYEIEQFIKAGFSLVTIGERILRVDTAVPAILSQIASFI